MLRRLLLRIIFIIIAGISVGQTAVSQESQSSPEFIATNEPIISGELKKWHPLTIGFTGPTANETATNPNPFLDYRLTVTLTAPSGRQVTAPGFFDGDGEGNGSGNIWRIRFSPDEIGDWQYTASFRQGTNTAIDLNPTAGTPVSFDGQSGVFNIDAHDCFDEGFLKWGRLEYVGAHYLKFRDGPYWIKGGTNSPENLLAYAGFDNTIDQGGLVSDFLHTYSGHVADWRVGDPDFVSADTGYDGKGLIGALNYLAAKHVNSVYFLPMNLGGDGQDTYPFIGAAATTYDKTHYDISKLNQWNVVFEHAQRKGIALQIVLAETEPPNERWLDGGDLGVERMLFFREMIARFGYVLALKWNLSEENDYSIAHLEAFADYIQALDWAKHPIAVHTHLNDQTDYSQMLGDGRFSATSFQYDIDLSSSLVETWRTQSANAGRPWVLDMDENFDSLTSWNEHFLRKVVLYPVYFSGGNVEWYLGYHNLPLGGDMRLEDFRTRKQMWDYTWYARKFMLENLSFWEMIPQDHLLTGETIEWAQGQVLAQPGQIYAVYLPTADGKGILNTSQASGPFVKRWFDPRTGQFVGEATQIQTGGLITLGSPPFNKGEDWVVLLQAVLQNTAQSFFANDENDAYLPIVLTSPCPAIIE